MTTCSENRELILRKATEADSSLVLQWRNAPEVRRWSFQKDVIPADTHEAWFHEALRSDCRYILIAESDGVPMGIVRVDRRENEAELHVYLGPEHMGRGLGSRVIEQGCVWARKHLGVSSIVANVIPENGASVRAFEKAGFKAVRLRMEWAGS